MRPNDELKIRKELTIGRLHVKAGQVVTVEEIGEPTALMLLADGRAEWSKRVKKTEHVNG